ncbi:MAG: recombinase family protein [Clostridia bacterium]|uniref:recombinase family protein n=1 Tax=Terrisporobacter sp. TaxID=1965305 RepID=UPI0039934C62
MIYGYARISKPSQKIDRQITSITKYCVNEKVDIRTEEFTGRKIEGRKEWNKLFDLVEEGDIIVFDSVSRMSRNAKEGIEQYFQLYDRGVDLVFIKEPYINTSTYRDSIDMRKLEELLGGLVANEDDKFAGEFLKPLNKFVVDLLKVIAKQQIIMAFEQAEKEVKDISDRTKSGLKEARKRLEAENRNLGRPPGSKRETEKSKKAKLRIMELSKDFKGILKDEDVWTLCKISKNSYYKYKREMIEEIKKSK